MLQFNRHLFRLILSPHSLNLSSPSSCACSCARKNFSRTPTQTFTCIGRGGGGGGGGPGEGGGPPPSIFLVLMRAWGGGGQTKMSWPAHFTVLEITSRHPKPPNYHPPSRNWTTQKQSCRRQPAVCESSITLPTVQASLKSIPQTTHYLTPPPPRGAGSPWNEAHTPLGVGYTPPSK